MAKKYEITIEGLTIDYYRVLNGADAYKYNEDYSNSFRQLINLATIPEPSPIKEKALHEILCRAHNYFIRNFKTNDYMRDFYKASRFADALCSKIKSYLQSGLVRIKR